MKNQVFSIQETLNPFFSFSDILDFEKIYLENNLLDCTDIFREYPSHLALCFKHRDFWLSKNIKSYYNFTF
jgi:hypothetical protein